MTMSNLDIQITVEGAERAAAAFEALALAADKAREAIERLADIRQGNLKIAMAGELMHCEFKMPPGETNNLSRNKEAIARSLKKAARLG